MDELSNRMLDFRAKHGMSIEKAAKGCGISAQTWRYIERGLQSPTRLTRKMLENYLMDKEGDTNESIDKSN